MIGVGHWWLALAIDDWRWPWMIGGDLQILFCSDGILHKPKEGPVCCLILCALVRWCEMEWDALRWLQCHELLILWGSMEEKSRNLRCNLEDGDWRKNIAELQIDSDLQYGMHYMYVLKGFDHGSGSGIKGDEEMMNWDSVWEMGPKEKERNFFVVDWMNLNEKGQWGEEGMVNCWGNRHLQ